MVTILTKARPQNIGKEDRSLLKSLPKSEDILILAGDKGKATVIMDKCDYAAKLDKIVSDTKVYELLKTDPIPKFKKKLIVMLTNMKQVEKITQDQYWQLYPT